MSTGMLNRSSRAEAGVRTAKLQSLFQTPVPPFHMVFPAPPGFGGDHPLYELHRAANRVYRERHKAYTAKGMDLSAPDLMSYIRGDVLENLLAVEFQTLGPVAIRRYRFLNTKKFWAWLPLHQEKVQALFDEFRKLYRRRRRAV